MTLRARIPASFLVLLLGLTGCSKPTLEERLKGFQGRWVVVSLEREGKASDARALKRMDVSIQKDSFKLSETRLRGPEPAEGEMVVGDLFIEEYLIQMDPAQSSGEIDFVVPRGDTQGHTRRGIFEFDDTSLKLCLGAFGQARPTEFTSQLNPPWTLMVLQKKP
jgi:uncharacterized protein (TIGR03067 family)